MLRRLQKLFFVKDMKIPLKNYDGSIARNSVEYNKFKQFNNLHQELLDKIEETLSRLK